MSALSDVRHALRATLTDICADVKVAAAPSDFTEQTNRFTVRLLLGEPDEGTENRLDELLAPSGQSSVKETLEADRTLGGLLSDIYVLKHSGYRVYEVAKGEKRLGTEFTVDTIL